MLALSLLAIGLGNSRGLVNRPRAAVRRARVLLGVDDISNPGEEQDYSAEFSRISRDASLNFAASLLAEAELGVDPKRRALWEQSRRTSELDAVAAARATLRREEGGGELGGDGTPVAAQESWRTQSRALGELSYWLIATGNVDAETILLDAIRGSADCERWLAVEADGLLRKGWSVHRSATVNSRMEAARGLIKAGKAREAADAFSAIAAECEPVWAEAHRWRGKTLHLALGDVDGAISAYEQALATSTRNYPLLFELGALMVRDAAIEAQLGSPRAAGSAARAQRGAEYLGRAAELNPLLAQKVAQLLGDDDD
ncbi:hypothetical protein T492DRAFT_1012016 [Pavlovales sp. CCMP2436]|nr:hypothetical protein T492DRAFT_1012016 [Pavlovales sp. CCMP2436]|mmetsp:Transcript_5166/g.13471  ORF Transcript_5166/g.13471 Transcript_5166/m.13471 type:complete len:315 (-) Transcript_5166:383-1327(-)